LVQSPDGTIRVWVEREDVEALLDTGWVLDNSWNPT
jgi:hypothetical protein